MINTHLVNITLNDPLRPTNSEIEHPPSPDSVPVSCENDINSLNDFCNDKIFNPIEIDVNNKYNTIDPDLNCLKYINQLITSKYFNVETFNRLHEY